MQKKVAPKLQAIATPSFNSKKDIAQDFNVSSKNISVIPNGIDFQKFSPNKNIPRIPGQIITTASADVPLKGLDFTLRAVADLKKRFPLYEIGCYRSCQSRRSHRAFDTKTEN